MQRDRNGLFAAFHLAAFAASAVLQLSMLNSCITRPVVFLCRGVVLAIMSISCEWCPLFLGNASCAGRFH